MASALWEAAKAGDTAEARRLLDVGAPVDCKNDADVSSRTAGALPARCRGNGDRRRQPGVILPAVGLLRQEPRRTTCEPPTVMAIEPAAKRAGCRWGLA